MTTRLKADSTEAPDGPRTDNAMIGLLIGPRSRMASNQLRIAMLILTADNIAIRINRAADRISDLTALSVSENPIKTKELHQNEKGRITVNLHSKITNLLTQPHREVSRCHHNLARDHLVDFLEAVKEALRLVSIPHLVNIVR